MRHQVVWFVIGVAVAAAPVQATQWVYQDKTIDSGFSRCLEKDAASEAVRKRVEFDAKSSCRELGYGWHLDLVKKEGDLSCTDCAEGSAKCQQVNVALQCRRLKPGSVGMGMIPWAGDE